VDELGALQLEMQNRHYGVANYLAMDESKFEAGAFYLQLSTFLDEVRKRMHAHLHK
jgi:hypothetical protein